jgi:hypothetical protein
MLAGFLVSLVWVTQEQAAPGESGLQAT